MDRGDAHRVPKNDNGEDSKEIIGWDMGYAGCKRHTRGSGNPVG